MNIDHEKLDALILALAKDVSGFWSTSGCCIGVVNGAHIRIEAQDEDVHVSPKNCCIKDSNHD